MDIKKFLELPAIRESVKSAGPEQWKALCPAHEDRNPSLSIGWKDGRILLFCHGGCSTEAICKAMRIRMKDLSGRNDRLGKAKGAGRIVATYDYRDEKGTLLYQVVRFEPKDFKCRRPGRKAGEWIRNLNKTQRVLYRLPELLQADAKEWVFIVEGEKDANNLAKIGLVATTNPGGAKKWRSEYNEILRNRRVVILPDNDKPGIDHVRKIAKELLGIASEVRIVELPGLAAQEDVSTWLERGGTKDQLLALVEAAKPYKASEEACESDASLEESDTNLTQQLMESCESLEFFPDLQEDVWAIIRVGDHQETVRIRSKRFRAWLRALSRKVYGKVARAQNLGDVIETLEGEAHDAPAQPVFIRLAEYDGKIYLDLGDPAWRVVEIDAEGWRILEKSPVHFRRPKGLLRLPDPVQGGSVKLLRPFVNIKDDADWILLIAWLLGALNPNGPYVPLFVTGEHGTAKSTVCRLIQLLIDPSEANLRAPPRSERNLMLAASNSRLLLFDNLSNIDECFSDALCRISTEGSYAARELYSDREEIFLTACRPTVFNSIVDVAERPDLLDRLICLTLGLIPETRRRTKRELFTEFEKVRPQILGALLNGVSHALRTFDDVNLPNPPRMADFAYWAIAGLPGVGLSPNQFLEAYARNRQIVSQLALETSVLTDALEAFMENEPIWSGRAGELLDELNKLDAFEKRHTSKSWPKTASVLSRQLKRLAPNLRRIGTDIHFDRSPDSSRTRIIKIRKSASMREMPSEPSEPSDAEENIPFWPNNEDLS